jgi:histidinol dehydrogenase
VRLKSLQARERRGWAGDSVHSVRTALSVQSVTAEAARRIAGPAAILARLEGLEAHARAADARLEEMPA